MRGTFVTFILIDMIIASRDEEEARERRTDELRQRLLHKLGSSINTEARRAADHAAQDAGHGRLLVRASAQRGALPSYEAFTSRSKAVADCLEPVFGDDGGRGGRGTQVARLRARRGTCTVDVVDRRLDCVENLRLASLLDTVERDLHPHARDPLHADSGEARSKDILKRDEIRPLQGERNREAVRFLGIGVRDVWIAVDEHPAPGKAPL